MDKENVVQVPFKDTKEVVAVFIAIGKAYEISMENGKLDAGDLLNLFPVVKSIQPGLDNLGNVKLEFINATEADKEEFEAWVKTQVDLKDKKIEQFIEAAFALVLDLGFFLKMFFTPAAVPPVEPGDVNGNSADSVE